MSERPHEGREIHVVTDYRKLFDLTGKTAVVLGAASGIGRSSAQALAALGARVLCADRTVEGAEATAAAIRADGGAANAVACDAANRADVADARGQGRQAVSAARYRGHDAGPQHPQDHARLHRRGYRPRARSQHQGHGVVLSGVRPHHDGATRRQPDRVLLDARRDDRAGACGLWRDQGGDRPVGERFRLGGRDPLACA